MFLDSTKITLTLPDRSASPQSCYNHLVLAVWDGNDDYENLKNRVSTVIEALKQLGLDIWIGGDLAFLTALYGLSNSSSYPCIWCIFRANTPRKLDKAPQTFDNSDYPLQSLEHFDALLSKPPKNKDDKLSVTKKYIWSVEPIRV